MRIRIGIIILFTALIFSNCFNGSGNKSTVDVDSTSVDQPSTITEVENRSIDNVEIDEQPSGRKIDFELAGYLLSRMLKEIAYMRNFNDSSSVINVKVLNNETFSPIAIPQNFEATFSKQLAGSYIEGFNGLKQALVRSMYTGDMVWEEKTYNLAIQELSGVDFVQTTEHSQPFKYINPLAINWAWQNFYRGPSTSSICDVSLSTLYDVVFKKFVRTLYISHQELKGNNIENEVNWYRNAIVMEKNHAPKLLAERYVKPNKYSKDEVNEFYYSLATGFWIRRSIDGTEGILINYLRVIIMDYDYDWGCRNFKVCDRG